MDASWEVIRNHPHFRLVKYAVIILYASALASYQVTVIGRIRSHELGRLKPTLAYSRADIEKESKF